MVVFFAFSNGFSGTRTMAKLLDLPEGVDCDHERKEPVDLFGNLSVSYLKVYHGGDAGKAIEEHRLKGINHVLKDGKHFGEVSGFLGYYIRGLHAHFPNAKFIHIYRNPKTHIISSYNRGLYLKNAKTKFLYELWQKPKGKSPKWKRLTRLEKCCWYWTNYNTYVMNKLDKIPKENQITIRFEDFTQGKYIDEIFEFLGFEVPPEEQIKDILSKKLGAANYRSAAKIRRVGKPLWKWNEIKQREKLQKMFQPVLDRLESRLTWGKII